MNKTMLMIALLGSALMAQNRHLANGFYAVEEANANAKNVVIRQTEGRKILLDTANFVPLAVEGKPKVNRDARGSSLRVQLAPDAAKRLEDLTRSHVNQAIAVVVDNKILSIPTVRSVIKDGKVSLTPCEDHSCQTLLRQLSQ